MSIIITVLSLVSSFVRHSFSLLPVAQQTSAGYLQHARMGQKYIIMLVIVLFFLGEEEEAKYVYEKRS